MKNELYFAIIWRTIVIFSIPIIASFAIENLHTFFGDVWVPYRKSEYAEFPAHWDWGVRHGWFFAMSSVLFTVSLLNAFFTCRRIALKNYPNLFS